MRNKFCFTILVFLQILLTTNLFAQQELVTGYYDSANEWFVFEYVSPEYGQRKIIYDPDNKIDPAIYAYVFRDDSTGVHIYNFKVLNGNKAKQLLDTIVIKFSATIYDQTAPSKDWFMDEYRAGRIDTWRWSKTRGKPSGIPQGGIQEGFSIKSKGLPSIVDVFFFGERRKKFSGPSPTYDPDEIHESFDRVFEQLKSLYPHTKVTVTRKTIGPKTPSADFKPIDFLDYIISLKHEAYNLGWIVQGRDDDEGKHDDEEEGIMKSLDKKLEKAKAELVKGDTKEAIEKLKSFIYEVEALYKEGNEKEEKDNKEKEDHSHITSEAYALLKYNAVYLIEKLGGKIEKEH